MKKKGGRTVPNCVKKNKFSFAEWLNESEKKNKQWFSDQILAIILIGAGLKIYQFPDHGTIIVLIMDLQFSLFTMNTFVLLVGLTTNKPQSYYKTVDFCRFYGMMGVEVMTCYLEQTHITNLENGLDLIWCLVGMLAIHTNVFVPHGGFLYFDIV